MYIQNFKDNTKHISWSTDSSTLLKNITNSCIFIAGSVFSFFLKMAKKDIFTSCENIKVTKCNPAYSRLIRNTGFWLANSSFTSYLSDSSFSLCGISFGRPLIGSCRGRGKKSINASPLTSVMWLETILLPLKHFTYSSREWNNESQASDAFFLTQKKIRGQVWQSKVFLTTQSQPVSPESLHHSCNHKPLWNTTV